MLNPQKHRPNDDEKERILFAEDEMSTANSQCLRFECLCLLFPSLALCAWVSYLYKSFNYLMSVMVFFFIVFRFHFGMFSCELNSLQTLSLFVFLKSLFTALYLITPFAFLIF